MKIINYILIFGSTRNVVNIQSFFKPLSPDKYRDKVIVIQPISIFELPPASAGGVGNECSIGFSQKLCYFG